MASTSVVFDILANDRASSKFNAVGKAASRSTGHMSKMGNAMKVAAIGGFGALVYGAASFAKSAVTTEKQFSTSMRLIQAATGATGGEVKKLNDLAIKMGADTSFSANDAADAMLELAKAGIDTKTIMGGGLAGTLTLAAAGGTELGTAATIASNALNTFNLKGRDMAKVAAALAGGANASSASVESLGQGLQQVGPGATNAGLSLQETVAALSAFDAAGIKGADAGTSLKTMLSRLVPQTEKAATEMELLGIKFTKADGSFKSLSQVSQILQDKLGGLTDEQRTQTLATLFGSDATRAATVLMHKGSKGIEKYIKATKDQNAAQDMANARMGGTAGALERLSGSIETAKLRLGQELAPTIAKVADGLGKNLVPMMEGVIDGGKKMVNAVAPAFKEIGEALKHLTSQGDGAGDMFNDTFIPALKLASNVVAGLVNFIDELPRPVKSFGVQAAIAAVALSKLNSAIVGIKSTAFITGMKQMSVEMSHAETRSGAVKDAFGKLGGAAKNAAGVGGIALLMSAMQDSGKEAQSLQHIFKMTAGGAGVGAMFGPIGALVGALGGVGLAAAFSQTKEQARKARLELMKSEGFEDSKSDALKLAQALNGVVHAYGATARAQVKAGLFDKDGLRPEVQALRDMGVSMDTIVSATMGQASAQQVVQKYLKGSVGEAQALYEKRLADYKVVQAQADEALRQQSAAGASAPRLSPELQAQLDDAKGSMDAANSSLDQLGVAQETYAQRVKDTTGAIKGHIATQEDLARQLHVSVEAYKKFPKDFRVNVEEGDLPQTSKDLLRLIKQYETLQDFKHIKALVSAPGAKLAADDVLALQKRYNLTPKQVKTLLELDGLPTTVKGIARAQAEHKKIDGKQVKTLLQLLGVDATLNDVSRVANALRGLDSSANDVNNYIYTHHVSTGGGRGGGADVYEDSGGAPKRTVTNTPAPSMPVDNTWTTTTNRTVNLIPKVLGAEAISRSVRGIGRLLDELSGRKVEARLGADDSDLVARIGGGRGLLDNLNKHATRSRLGADDSDLTTGVARAHGLIRDLSKRFSRSHLSVDDRDLTGRTEHGHRLLDSLNRHATHSRLDADGRPIETRVGKAHKLLKSLDKRASRAHLDADDSSMVARIRRANELLDDFNGRGVTPRITVNAGKFHGIGAGIVRNLANGINGSAHESESAVNKMLAAITKALKKKDISEAAAKQMREAVQAMAREADKGRAMLQKRADFAASLRDSFASELNLGDIVSSETFAGIGSITGGAQSLAARLKAFAVQLKELRQAHIPKGLISEIASLGSDQGSKAAAAILSGSGSEQTALSSAYTQLQHAAALAGGTAADTQYGSVKQIKNEFHITINGSKHDNPREMARDLVNEIQTELLKKKRVSGLPLGLS